MSCTLIISSPTSQTYYHADAQPNLLWQVRGVKRLWVYPAGDPTLVAPELMENIFASFADEEVPFQKSWDARAECIDLHPDEVICWPHNAPHRVVNIEGLNVSLSTIHETDETDRRKLIYCANRFFRNKTPLPFRSVREDGLGAYLKRQAFRTVRRAGLVHTPPRRVYLSDLRIDASAPLGWRKLAEGPVLTEFSRKDFRLSRDASGAVNVLPRTADA